MQLLTALFYCLRFDILLISLSKLIYEKVKSVNENKQIWNYVIEGLMLFTKNYLSIPSFGSEKQ